MITDVIQSPGNNEFKKLKSLKQKKKREKYGEYLVEGLRIVEHAKAQDVLIKVILSENFFNQEKNADLIQSLLDEACTLAVYSDKLFKEICDTETPQGILGLVKLRFYEANSIADLNLERLLILDRIQDPGNLGTLIRTADAAGFHGIVLLKGCVDHNNSKVVRSAMGSSVYMPIVLVDDNKTFFDLLKHHAYKVYGTDLNTDFYHDDIDYPNKLGIIIGNEANGVSEAVLALVDARIKIPMLGQAESLNASIAGSVIMYEVVRQHRKSVL